MTRKSEFEDFTFWGNCCKEPFLWLLIVCAVVFILASSFLWTYVIPRELYARSILLHGDEHIGVIIRSQISSYDENFEDGSNTYSIVYRLVVEYVDTDGQTYECLGLWGGVFNFQEDADKYIGKAVPLKTNGRRS